MHYAAEAGHIPVLDALLNAGARIDQIDVKGDTVSSFHLSIIYLFIYLFIYLLIYYL